jgi:hypothetical protein
MPLQLEEDKYLTIQLLSFDRPTEKGERFYFLEMSTLQATTLLNQDTKLVNARIVAYTSDNKFLDENFTANFKTVGDFNQFFLSHKDYYIHDCELMLENGIRISSHDDGEVSIQFDNNSSDPKIIDRIFQKYNLDKKVIETLKDKSGHYIEIDSESNITADYETFDDYIKKQSR